MFTDGQINSIRDVVQKVLKKHTQLIPDTIRERLWTKGTYSDGTPIVTYKAQPPFRYAPFTVAIKKSKGQPTDRVTLRDSGAFYQSIRVVAGSDSLTIEGDTDKFSDNLDTDGILELSDEDIEKIIPQILEDVQKEIKEALVL